MVSYSSNLFSIESVNNFFNVTTPNSPFLGTRLLSILVIIGIICDMDESFSDNLSVASLKIFSTFTTLSISPNSSLVTVCIVSNLLQTNNHSYSTMWTSNVGPAEIVWRPPGDPPRGVSGGLWTISTGTTLLDHMVCVISIVTEMCI